MLRQIKEQIGTPIASYTLLVVASIVTTGISFLLYQETRSILEDRLKERLVAIASTAALQFDPSDIQNVHISDDYEKEEYKRMVFQLQQIRNENKNVFYAYLLRPTDAPSIFEFIADADSLDPYAEIDLNHDDVIDENDALAAPGDEYDASEAPSLIAAVDYPTTDDIPLEADAWGTFMSGYAPIKLRGETIAVLAIDVEVSDFKQLVTQTFLPFLAFIIFLFLVLSGLTFTLVKMWGSRVDILRELDRQKDELLGMVSHQLATPITSVKWYTEMMLTGDVGKITKEQREHLTSMQAISADLTDLVSMILDVSRIQLGRIKIEKSKLDVGAFFKEIKEVIEPRAIQKKIDFVFSVPKKLPPAFLDKRYTRMTIENLLSNAVKYTPEKGKVEFVVTFDGKILHCEVRDNGYGIPEADQAKIFGKLFRASNVRNEVDGNGFGLYVAKGAVEAQGGKIWFKSKEKVGTTFFVELPINEKASERK